MSILIKGIDLPKDIDFVEITTYKNGIPRMTIGKGRDDAIQIDRPHGRLIDGSILFKEYQNLCNGILCRDCPFFAERNSCSLEEWILDAPTILEAEE